MSSSPYTLVERIQLDCNQIVNEAGAFALGHDSSNDILGTLADALLACGTRLHKFRSSCGGNPVNDPEWEALCNALATLGHVKND